MKPICYLLPAIALIASCDDRQKALRDNFPGKNNAAAPEASPVVRSVVEIPWADPALVKKPDDC